MIETAAQDELCEGTREVTQREIKSIANDEMKEVGRENGKWFSEVAGEIEMGNGGRKSRDVLVEFADDLDLKGKLWDGGHYPYI